MGSLRISVGTSGAKAILVCHLVLGWRVGYFWEWRDLRCYYTSLFKDHSAGGSDALGWRGFLWDSRREDTLVFHCLFLPEGNSYSSNSISSLAFFASTRMFDMN